MSRVVHFEIAMNHPEKTSKFYQDVFGWNIQKWDGPMEYWMAQTGDEKKPGINGGFMRPMSPGNLGTINTIDVSSVDQTITSVESKGGTLVMPKTEVPGVGYMAYCQDPEGNIFGIMEFHKSYQPPK